MTLEEFNALSRLAKAAYLAAGTFVVGASVTAGSRLVDGAIVCAILTSARISGWWNAPPSSPTIEDPE